MAEDGRDMLIRMIGPDGAFPGECTADFVRSDPLMAGFQHNFFSDGQDFGFAVGLEDPNKKTDKQKQQHAMLKMTPPHLPSGGGGGANRDAIRAQQALLQSLQLQTKTEPPTAGFDEFRNGASKTYPADLQPFTFTKLFDAASLSIFQACSLSQTLPIVTVVKRKATGKRTTSEREKVLLRGYMRFEFTDVLITDIDWEEDAVIKETVKFICRKVVVKYAAESDDGTLTGMPQQEWSMRNANQGGT